MYIILIPIAFIFLFGAFLYSLAELGFYITNQKRYFEFNVGLCIDAFIIIFLPCLGIYFFEPKDNTCCHGDAAFSPDHRLSLYSLIVLCMATYFYARVKPHVVNPIVELICNTILLIGIVLNFVIIIQLNLFTIFWNGPIIVLFALQIIENRQPILAYDSGLARLPFNSLGRFLWRILKLNPLLQIPILLLLGVPIMTLLIGLFILLGQKPDALIRVFTETHGYGFSKIICFCHDPYFDW